jgi:dolichol-phosphate mannosyltransferase
MNGGSIVNWGVSRRLISKGANLLAKIVLGIPVHDVTTGYRCYKKNVLDTINLNEIKSSGYSFLEEILFRCKQDGFKICETPITFVDRIHGNSKLSRTEIIKFFFTLVRLRLT